MRLHTQSNGLPGFRVCPIRYTALKRSYQASRNTIIHHQPQLEKHLKKNQNKSKIRQPILIYSRALRGFLGGMGCKSMKGKLGDHRPNERALFVNQEAVFCGAACFHDTPFKKSTHTQKARVTIDLKGFELWHPYTPGKVEALCRMTGPEGFCA